MDLLYIFILRYVKARTITRFTAILFTVRLHLERERRKQQHFSISEIYNPV